MQTNICLRKLIINCFFIRYYNMGFTSRWYTTSGSSMDWAAHYSGRKSMTRPKFTLTTLLTDKCIVGLERNSPKGYWLKLLVDIQGSGLICSCLWIGLIGFPQKIQYDKLKVYPSHRAVIRGIIQEPMRIRHSPGVEVWQDVRISRIWLDKW